METKQEKIKRFRRFDEGATSNFRVIDIESGCVRSAPLNLRYACLSYVWGQTPTFKLLKSNFEELATAGNLDGIRRHLPRTVNHAIDLLTALGERYLWVDALCLVQDDLDDVTLGVGMMNTIYRGAHFTIVAGSGVNANAGLPALKAYSKDGGRSQTLVREVAPGITMTVIHSIDWHLSRSVYNERGWTLQELVLPRRTVIFINGQVYYRCQEANWSDETWADKWNYWLDADDSNISRIPDILEGFLPCLWAYQKLCEDFSGRTLRSDGDAIRALAGITRPLGAGMETTMVEGLPGYYLDHFALFIATNGDLRRRDRFASFSWAGWAGKIMWPRENFEWFHEADGTTKTVRDTANIFKHLRHNRIVSWNTLNQECRGDHLTFKPYELPSSLLEMMQRFPDVFPSSSRETDPLRLDQFRDDRKYSSGTGYSSGIPMWDRNSDPTDPPSEWRSRSVEDEQSGPLKGFSVRAFDSVNSQAELNKLIERLAPPRSRSRLALQNWMACRHLRRSKQGDQLATVVLTKSRCQRGK